MTITQNDLLDALREAFAAPDAGEGQTTEDLAVSTGRARDTIRKGLKVLQREGRLEVVQLRRVNLAGAVAPVVGYRVKPK